MNFKNFFLSLKTAVWSLFVLVCLFFTGSALMPAHREIFGPMNDGLLVAWANTIARHNIALTWWLFASFALLVLLTVNTFACSIQAVRGKWSRSDFLLRISPQVIHAGFLFILLAHLLSAAWGYKLSGMMPEGGFARLPENRAIALHAIDVQTDASGAVKDWSATVSLYENNAREKSGVLGPNQPLFYQGTAIYLSSLNFEAGRSAHLLVVKDPGAVWALIGGVFFMAGSVILLVLKWKKT
jgi:hypothetical protein